jgi:PII-like signaling protein
MSAPRDATLLRVFIGEQQQKRSYPVYESIVLKARELKLAGATVLRGPMGYGASSQLHEASLWRLSANLPIVIEIVDIERKIMAFLPVLEQMLGSRGLVTLEKVQVITSGDTRIEESSG